MRKYLIVSGVVVLLLMGLNFRWLHAAVVVAKVSVASVDASSCEASLLNEAEQRISLLYESAVESAPWVVCLSEPELGLGTTVGTTNFAPGLPAILVMGPDGANVDVIAHEWAHAELAERVGVLVRTYRIPTWLDEGLAMQVDYREGYAQPALREMQADSSLISPDPILLQSPQGFFHVGKQGRYHYAWSRERVRKLLVAQELPHLLRQYTQ